MCPFLISYQHHILLHIWFISRESNSRIANVCLSVTKTYLASDIWFIWLGSLVSEISDLLKFWSLWILISVNSDLWEFWSLRSPISQISDLCSFRFLLSDLKSLIYKSYDLSYWLSKSCLLIIMPIDHKAYELSDLLLQLLSLLAC